MINQLTNQAVFGSDKKKAQQKIKVLAEEKGIRLASINNLYSAKAQGKISKSFTVPAINIRGMTYDIAQTVFQSAKKLKVGAFIFEIARSEINYTNQSPEEYVAVILGAAIKTNFKGPVFIQGDHYQLKVSDKAGQPEKGEIEKIKILIKESIKAGFYNIDIDASTLVDYSQKEIYDQQKSNYENTAKLAQYTRQIEPKGVTVSIGGEIGHIGGKNSTKKELQVFMKGFNKKFKSGEAKADGLSKISIQTGTHHGGVVLPSGKFAKVNVDFEILKNLAQIARQYGMGGTVQHGASTLKDKYFAKFPKAQAIEIHLATGFQNIIMDHSLFPKQLLEKMYRWLNDNAADEQKKGQTNPQFYYKLRKKAWGQFKREIWNLPEEAKKQIKKDLTKRFEFLFKQLNVENTKKMVEKYITR